MNKETCIFLDFDDTLVDSKEHGLQYVRALAMHLSEEQGGEIANWTKAIATGIIGMKQRYLWYFNASNLEKFDLWMDIERVATTMGIFQLAGSPYPESVNMLQYARDMQFKALKTCQAAHAGVKPALEALRDSDIQMHAASANESEYLRGAFHGLGLEALIQVNFGPDLINCAKEGQRYYVEIFKYLGLDPERAIVVDDQIECLDWAVQLGAQAIHANIGGNRDMSDYSTITHFSQLPSLVSQMRRG